MSTVDAVADLIATVSVEPDGPDRFVGRGSRNDGVDATFGGHFLGQATSAAQATVDPERRLHSLHAYFLRGGRPGEPYTHQVERVRDGRSFCTRRVRTSQGEGGATQFELTASFATEEGGPSLAAEPPPDFARLPPPDSLPTYGELMAGLDPLPLPADWALRNYGLDLRTVEAPWRPAGASGAVTRGIRLWLRSAGPLPVDHHLQTAILAYQSDESLADNVAAPWGATWGSEGVVFVSLDHAMWFHRPFDLNQWHFLDQRAVTVGHGRGLATATVWNEAGELVASATQEALLRLSDEFLVGES